MNTFTVSKRVASLGNRGTAVMVLNQYDCADLGMLPQLQKQGALCCVCELKQPYLNRERG